MDGIFIFIIVEFFVLLYCVLAYTAQIRLANNRNKKNKLILAFAPITFAYDIIVGLLMDMKIIK